jgi:hypothetical protein
MANTDKNIVITPNVGQTAEPRIFFSGADASTTAQTITLRVLPDNGGTLSFEGSSGQLFSITNILTGTLFSVNDISGIPSLEVLDTGQVKLAQYAGSVLVGTGTDNATDKLQVAGTVTHTGLNPSSGTNLDQILTWTKSLTITTEWQDTGIKATDLTTGSYFVQLYANDIGSGGSNSNEYYTGVLSWYAGDTDSAVTLPTDEIPLHRSGAGGEGGLYLRTYRTMLSDPNNLKLQIYGNYGNVSASNYVFKFRRII